MNLPCSEDVSDSEHEKPFETTPPLVKVRADFDLLALHNSIPKRLNNVIRMKGS